MLRIQVVSYIFSYSLVRTLNIFILQEILQENSKFPTDSWSIILDMNI